MADVFPIPIFVSSPGDANPSSQSAKNRQIPVLILPIVNRGEWLWSPANVKRANKDAKIYVGRSTTVHNLLFCVHTLCMSNVTKTFLLVSSSVSSKQLLCFVHGQGQIREQKHRTKNFVEFHNHSFYWLCFYRAQSIFSFVKLNAWTELFYAWTEL